MIIFPMGSGGAPWFIQKIIDWYWNRQQKKNMPTFIEECRKLKPRESIFIDSHGTIVKTFNNRRC